MTHARQPFHIFWWPEARYARPIFYSCAMAAHALAFSHALAGASHAAEGGLRAFAHCLFPLWVSGDCSTRRLLARMCIPLSTTCRCLLPAASSASWAYCGARRERATGPDPAERRLLRRSGNANGSACRQPYGFLQTTVRTSHVSIKINACQARVRVLVTHLWVVLSMPRSRHPDILGRSKTKTDAHTYIDIRKPTSRVQAV